MAPVPLYNSFQDVFRFVEILKASIQKILQGRSKMKKNKHIAIVGGGLVGSMLSIYLAKRGYRISVFERRSDMRRHSVDAGRSINLALSNRGIKSLEELGLADQLKQASVPMHGRMMHDIDGQAYISTVRKRRPVYKFGFSKWLEQSTDDGSGN